MMVVQMGIYCYGTGVAGLKFLIIDDENETFLGYCNGIPYINRSKTIEMHVE